MNQRLKTRLYDLMCVLFLFLVFIGGMMNSPKGLADTIPGTSCSNDFRPCYTDQGYRIWIQDQNQVVNAYCCSRD